MFDPRKIWSSSQLPTLPSVAVKLLELARAPDTEIKAFVDVIKTDPALSAKVLKSANSTFFGLSSKVTSVDRAVPVLGTTVVNSLALSFSLAESAMTTGPLTEHFTAYWKQSIVQAAAAESLARYLSGGLDCEYFLGGLLMDLGRLAMLKTVPQDYLRVLTVTDADERSLSAIETEMLGVSHASIGAQLMKNWNLPESLAMATRHQDATAEELRGLKDEPSFSLIVATAIAASLGDYFCAKNKGEALVRLRGLAEEFLAVSGKGLTELLDRVKARTMDTAGLFAVNMDELGDPSDLMAEANEQLAQLALREHVAKTQAAALHKKTELEKEELVSKNEQLQRQALRDSLTRVYNRRFFDEVLAKEVQRGARNATPLGLIFADIDRFKLINDTYGHQFGDVVLQRVAVAFGEVGRTSDTLARYGGEEFVILVHQPTEKGLQKLADRLCARIESEVLEFEGKAVPVTVSIGVAMAIPARNDLEAGSKLISAADDAMYESKQNGRNQVHLKILMDDAERRLLQGVMQRRFSRWLVQRQVLDIPTVSKAMVDSSPEQIRIGQLAIRHGLIEKSQIDTVLQELERTNAHFGETAVSLGYFTHDNLISLLAIQQEDPQRLAVALKQLRVLEPGRVDALVQEYMNETLPRPARLPVAVS